MEEKLMEDVVAGLRHDDANLAAKVLTQLLTDGDQGALLVALREMTKALGGAPIVAAKAGLNTSQFYRILSRNGNPRLSSFSAILKVMGLQLRVRHFQ